MVLLTFYGGLRIGEVAALKWGDVVGTDGVVKPEVLLAPDQVKFGHARVVFINEKLRKELTTYIKAVKQRAPDLPMFRTQKQQGFSANTLCQHFFWMYKRAGVDGASSHSGRRTFITTLASKGVGVRVLASLAGHRSIATTQAYIDVNDVMKRKAVELA